MFRSTRKISICWLVAVLASLLMTESFADESTIVAGLEFDETWNWRTDPNGVRSVSIVSSAARNQTKRCLILYATPNGSTLEQTLGCRAMEGLDWKYDIQHIAAQVRLIQSIDTETQYILTVVQSPALSWPEFRRTHAGANNWINHFVSSLQKEYRIDDTILSCHSGGGSFLWGWINSLSKLSDSVSRIIFLDANYSYSEEEKHGEKLNEWLSNSKHHLMVVAYDDREITLNGKKVIGSDGGTFRATARMIDGLSKYHSLSVKRFGPFVVNESADRRLRMMVHQNPENKILHTSLVGDMNGLAHTIFTGTSYESQIPLGSPRAYEPWINSKPATSPHRSKTRIATELSIKRLHLPARNASDETGTSFIARIRDLDRPAREQQIQQALLSGNVPEVSRVLVPIQFAQKTSENQLKTVVFHAACDYISIGSEQDHVRIPVTPDTGLTLARMTDCSFLTSKLSDEVFWASSLRLPPKPLREARESPETFLNHHAIIESQLQSIPFQRRSEFLPVVAGIKKDIVWSKKLLEKPHRVAIYGWHYSDGKPIQPVYAGHVDWYTDYSHGLRLIANEVSVDGQNLKLQDALRNPEFQMLFSDEGLMDLVEIERATQWRQ